VRLVQPLPHLHGVERRPPRPRELAERPVTAHLIDEVVTPTVEPALAADPAPQQVEKGLLDPGHRTVA
jgi:hypothetical protein